MNAGSFSAAMIQMRSSLTPGANIDDAVRMIGEAKAAGADYVLHSRNDEHSGGQARTAFSL